MLCIIETLLDVIIRAKNPIECTGYSHVPLPCVRSLWETPSTSEWAMRYRELNERKKSDRILRVWDIRTYVRLSVGDLGESIGSEGRLCDLMAWFEGLDQFGTMVWMAATLSTST